MDAVFFMANFLLKKEMERTAGIDVLVAAVVVGDDAPALRVRALSGRLEHRRRRCPGRFGRTKEIRPSVESSNKKNNPRNSVTQTKVNFR